MVPQARVRSEEKDDATGRARRCGVGEQVADDVYERTGVCEAPCASRAQ